MFKEGDIVVRATYRQMDEAYVSWWNNQKRDYGYTDQTQFVVVRASKWSTKLKAVGETRTFSPKLENWCLHVPEKDLEDYL